MMRAFLSVAVVYAIGVPLSLLVNILLARWMSVEEFGNYSFALSFAILLALPVSGGLVLLLTREVAKSESARDPERYARLVNTTVLWVLLASVGLGAVSLGVFQLVSTELDTLLPLALALVPGLAFVAFGEGIAKGFGKPVYGEALRQIIAPFLLLAGATLFWLSGSIDAESVLITHIAALSLAGLLALFGAIQAAQNSLKLKFASVEEIKGLATAFVSFGMITGLGLLISQFATIALGVLGDGEQVAYLKVAERGSQLVALPLMFVNAILGPKIVQAHDFGDRDALIRLSRSAARLALAVAMPIAVILIIWGKLIITISFGADYADAAYAPMVALCIAQLLFVGLGMPGLILAMTGHEMDNLISRVMGFFVLAALVLWLSASYGVFGAALGVAFGIVIIKVLATSFLFWRLRFLSGPI